MLKKHVEAVKKKRFSANMALPGPAF